MAPSTPSSATAPIGGRFRRDDRVRTVGAGTWWHGVDTRSGEPVEILQVQAERAAAVTDAAVRARAISHPQLPEIIEVIHAQGKDGDGYVVTRSARGRTLADRLRRPLPPEEARRIAAEVGTALAAADEAGIHHGHLRPQDVIVDDDAVTVTGVGLTADLTGTSNSDAADADLRSLAGLLYAGLTARWPVTAGKGSGLPTAPQRGDSPVAPSQLASDVPADLDALCTSALAQRPTGATTLIDLTTRMRGDDTRSTRTGRVATVAPRPPAATSSDSALPTTDEERPEAATTRTEGDASHPDAVAATGGLVAGAGSAVTSRWRRFRRDRAARATTTPQVQDSRPAGSAPPEPSAETGQTHVPETVSPPVADAATGVSPSSGTTVPQDPDPTMDPDGKGIDDDDAVTPQEGAATRRRASAAMTRAASAAAGSTVATRAGSQMRAAGVSAQRMMDQLHPEIPHLTPQEKRSRTRAVVAMLMTGLALALVLSLIGILTLFHNSKDIAQALASPSTSASALPKKQAARPVVLAATAEDPFGDDEEHNEQAPLVIDRNPRTAWYSNTYNSVDFGNLKKGVGITLTLQAAAPVSRVIITQQGQGGAVELRNAPGGSYEGSSPMVTGVQMQSPRTVIPLPKHPVAKSVLVWFTSLPRTSQGYQLAISEISVR